MSGEEIELVSQRRNAQREVDRLGIVLLASCLAPILLGGLACGGGSGGVVANSAPSSSIISANPSCTPSTIQISQGPQTSQCSANIQGTGNFSSAATWSAQGGGAIDANGKYIAPASVSSAVQVTITATSVQDSTKSGATTVLINPAPVVMSVTISPTAASILAGGTSQFTAMVNGTGNPSQAVTWAVNGVAGGSAPTGTVSATGLYTAPASPVSATISATSIADPTKSASAQMTVNPLPAPPAVTVSPATVPLGASQQIAVTVSDPSATLTCSVTGPGTCAISNGNAVTYSVPSAVPVSWTSSISVTAKNAGGSGSGSAALTLAPIITSIAVLDAHGNALGNSFFCVRDLGCAAVLKIDGFGFCVGCLLHTQLYGDLTLVSGTNPTEIQAIIFGDTPHWSPGPIDVSVSPPSGSGGGDSNTAHFDFIGNQNTLACGPVECYSLDQGAGMVHVFDTTTGNHLRDLRVGALVPGIAVDDVTGYILTTQSNKAIGVWKPDGSQVAITGFSNTQLPMAISARGENSCFTRDMSGDIACFPLTQFTTSLPIVGTGNAPMNVLMTLIGSQLYATVLNIGDATLSLVAVPQVQAGPFVGISSFTTNLPSSLQGGTQLAMLEQNGTTPKRIAAVLSRFDKNVSFVDIHDPLHLQVTRPFAVGGDPFRIAADNVHGSFIVAFVDPATGGTKFAKLDAATGAVSPLSATSSLLTVGLAVSADGTKFYVSMRDKFEIVPNN